MSSILANLSLEKKKAVIQLGYQLIVSAAGRPLSSSDDASIDIILGECITFTGNKRADEILANSLWNDAILFNTFEAFKIVSLFSNSEKEAFAQMMLRVAREDNSYLRLDILSQILDKINV